MGRIQHDKVLFRNVKVTREKLESQERYYVTICTFYTISGRERNKNNIDEDKMKYYNT